MRLLVWAVAAGEPARRSGGKPGEEQASLRWMTEQAPRLQQLSQQPAPAARGAHRAGDARGGEPRTTVVRLQPQENVCRSPFSPALSVR